MNKLNIKQNKHLLKQLKLRFESFVKQLILNERTFCDNYINVLIEFEFIQRFVSQLFV